MLLVGYVLWFHFGLPYVGAWTFLGLLFVGIRIVLFKWMHDGKLLPNNYRARELVTGICLAIAGAHWGLAGWLYLDPNNPTLYSFSGAAVLGVFCAIIASTAIRPNLWLAFALSEFSFVTAKFYASGFQSLSVMSLIFVAGMYVIVKSVGKRIEASVTKDFENAELLTQVRKARDLAEQANLEKSQFMAATSHDLRQPLHAQGLLIEALKGQKLDPAPKELLGKIEQSNTALHQLFNSLLEISQLDARTVEVNKSHQPLLDICNQVVIDFEPQATAKGLRIEIIGDDCTVLSDPILLNRIIRNLVSNAIKYTDQGMVTLMLSEQKEAISLAIEDTGLGIPADQHDNIFKEYQQLHNEARDRQKGVGLGLAVVKRMCQLLDLSIHIDSKVGEGSCFTLTLPRGDSEQIIKNKVEISTPTTAEQLDVIVVDDELPILEAMATLLQQWNCRCHAYPDMETAKQAIQSNTHSADIIISDYRLTDNVTGIDCINQLRHALGAEVPAVLLSGDTDPKLLSKVQNAGFYMLHKPLKPNKLRNVMSLLVEKKGQS
jgi:signal transduction histidine kinase/CheY-like chemotaxis protein